MRISICLFLATILAIDLSAQSTMTPELLWQLGRVGGIGLVDDGQTVIYQVTHYDADDNKSSTKYYRIAIAGGDAAEIASLDDLNLPDPHLSPDGMMLLQAQSVNLEEVLGSDRYDDVDQSEVYVYDDLMYRHWDRWADGSYSHVFVGDKDGAEQIDIMAGMPYHCPTQPFGGGEDYLWHPNGKEVIYVTKEKKGRDYAVSTNTDVFSYNIESGERTNLTEGNLGYDMQPAFSTEGQMAWLQMKRDGYESDKSDLVVQLTDGNSRNLTAHWDGTVSSFSWSQGADHIFFVAPVGGAKHLFSVQVSSSQSPEIKQVTQGPYDVTGIVAQSGQQLVVSRTDMNHATELYVVDLTSGAMRQLTHVNDAQYDEIILSKVEARNIETTDGKEMLTWVIYPPDFDPNKKYPTLLYCQGGPQGALSQFYSFRWNFQLMAAHGYIVVAPNRRGMPGHGVKWNEQISKDYGGQNMDDYLSAIDALAKEPYVDNERIGAVGASYGGYSIFYLAGIHNGRFKSLISHDGIFNWRSMYGTTEELFFVNFDIGGPYWDIGNRAAQKSYREFNPIDYVDRWDTPILIYQGGKDYRVPIGQGLEAFQAAQLQGIKSRLIYLPEENHWVLSAQNALVWQREFFRWLEETLK